MGLIGLPQYLDDDAAIDEKFFRTSKRTFRLWATDDMNAMQVRAALPISLYSAHPSDSGAKLKGIGVSLDPPGKVQYDAAKNPGGAVTPPDNGTWVLQWKATLDYGPVNPQEVSEDGDPTNQPIQVFYEGQTFQDPADEDKDGNPVVNSAYDYFDPPIMRDKTRVIVRAIRNELSFSGSLAASLADCVNSDQILDAGGGVVFDVRTLKTSFPRGVPKWSQFLGANYYEVEYIFTVNHDTWDFRTLNQGYRELDPSASTKRRQILVEGQPATSPVLLDSSGHALLPPVDHTNVNYVKSRVYKEISFASSFGFPVGTFT